MKKIIPLVLITALLSASCTKTQSRPNDDSGNNTVIDDHGGNSGSGNGGGGDNIASSTVPAAVMATFVSQFPGASAIEWKKLSNGNYKVQFYSGGIRWEATYTPSGTRVKLERAS